MNYEYKVKLSANLNQAKREKAYNHKLWSWSFLFWFFCCKVSLFGYVNRTIIWRKEQNWDWGLIEGVNKASNNINFSWKKRKKNKTGALNYFDGKAAT